MPAGVQDELYAHARVLALVGPQLGRPRVDTLKGSRHANMKELAARVWRIAFAFDPAAGYSLVAGDKSGGSEERFYKQLIAVQISVSTLTWRR